MNKPELIKKIKSIDTLSNEEKTALIELISHNKRYGLVWENKIEEAEELLRENLPVLKEVVEKRIAGKKSENKNEKPDLFKNIQSGKENNSSESFPNHILIEGDNLHTLTALSFTHQGKIDIIYMDPPYNTGKEDDFKYNDNYVDKEDAFRHSKWISFIERRLTKLKMLLKDNGVIFISIGDDEISQLTLLMNQIFGEENRLGIIARVAKTAGDKGSYFAPSKDYILCYSKIKNSVPDFKDEVDESLFKKIEEDGPRKGEKFRDDVALYQASLDTRPNQRYFIQCPDGSFVIPPGETFPDEKINGAKAVPVEGDGVWRWSRDEGFEKNKHLIVFKQTKKSPLLNENGERAKWNLYTKSYLVERSEGGKSPRDFLDEFINRKGADLIKQYDIDFSYSKPVELIKHLIKITGKSNDIVVMDAFAGSGTTLHSVLELNQKDEGKRLCILATNNEVPSKVLIALKAIDASKQKIEDNGICRTVTYPRCNRLIVPYTNKKGQQMPFFPENNLRYFKTEFVGRERSLKNKRRITELSVDLLRIKDDCYTEINGAKNIRIFNERELFVVVVADDTAIPNAVELIQLLPEKSQIKVYVFSEEQDPYTEDFYEVLDRVELCALPDAIYKAYQHVLPKKKVVMQKEENLIQ